MFACDLGPVFGVTVSMAFEDLGFGAMERM